MGLCVLLSEANITHRFFLLIYIPNLLPNHFHSPFLFWLCSRSFLYWVWSKRLLGKDFYLCLLNETKWKRKLRPRAIVLLAKFFFWFVHLIGEGVQNGNFVREKEWRKKIVTYFGSIYRIYDLRRRRCRRPTAFNLRLYWWWESTSLSVSLFFFYICFICVVPASLCS